MFDHTCSACGKRRLIFSDQITSLENTGAGIVLSFTCWCGAEQTIVTGKRAADAPGVSGMPSPWAAREAC